MLRPYQTAAVEATLAWLAERPDPPVIVLPTGAGKSHVIAALAAHYAARGRRVLVLAHVKELVEQNAEKITAILGPDLVGVYSAGLNRREEMRPVVVGGIQSVIEAIANFRDRSVVIIDECHLVPAAGEGRYRSLLHYLRACQSQLSIIGCTATPYRLDSGLVYGPDRMFGGIAYEAKLGELIAAGYLCQLRSKVGSAPDLRDVRRRSGGDYITSDLEAACMADQYVRDAIDELLRWSEDRHSVLVFTAGVVQSDLVCRELVRRGLAAAMVAGTTPTRERDDIIERFRRGDLQYLCNVNVLTTGFDSPNTDCIALMRPTLSPGLYYQMVGRGFRLHPSKQNCLVLDFGGNIRRHGPVDRIRPPSSHAAEPTDDRSAPTETSVDAADQYRVCVQCCEYHAGIVCPACGAIAPDDLRFDRCAADVPILSAENGEEEEHRVERWSARRHVRRGAPPGHPATLCVTYVTEEGEPISEWVCCEHRGYPRYRAICWWFERGGRRPAPESVAEALARWRELRMPDEIVVRRGNKWPEIVERRQCVHMTSCD